MPTDKPRIVEDEWWARVVDGSFHRLVPDGMLPLEPDWHPLNFDWRPVRIETTDHAKRVAVLWECEHCGNKGWSPIPSDDCKICWRCQINHPDGTDIREVARVEIPAED